MSFYELFIGFRYLKSKKSQGFISFNTLLSILIVFIGVFIIIVVISVMNGFQATIKDKILDVDSHITISNSFEGFRGRGIKNYRELVDKIKGIDSVRSVSPFIQGQGLFRYKSNISYVMIRGMGEKDNAPEDVKRFIITGAKDYIKKRNIDPDSKKAEEITAGSVNNYTKKKGIYIGTELALMHDIKIGQKIELIVPKGQLTASTGVTPGLGKFKVLGFFKTHYYEFDTKLVLMSLPDAQKLYSVGDIVWGIAVKIDDVYKMKHLSSEVQSSVGFEYITMTAEEKNQNLFYALKLEKLIMTIILFLVIISAGFTIMGTLVMVVMEKRKAIGILKSMGAKPNSIMMIFVLEGFLIGVIGSLLGVIFGLAASLNLEAIIVWIENSLNSFLTLFYSNYNVIAKYLSDNFGFPIEQKMFFNISIVPSNVYYIDSIPTEVNPEFIVFIAVFAVILSTIAAIFPSWSASKQKPVETIRYE